MPVAVTGYGFKPLRLLCTCVGTGSRVAMKYIYIFIYVYQTCPNKIISSNNTIYHLAAMCNVHIEHVQTRLQLLVNNNNNIYHLTAAGHLVALLVYKSRITRVEYELTKFSFIIYKYIIFSK